MSMDLRFVLNVHTQVRYCSFHNGDNVIHTIKDNLSGRQVQKILHHFY
jgi:hypothetical protein